MGRKTGSSLEPCTLATRKWVVLFFGALELLRHFLCFSFLRKKIISDTLQVQADEGIPSTTGQVYTTIIMRKRNENLDDFRSRWVKEPGHSETVSDKKKSYLSVIAGRVRPFVSTDAASPTGGV